MPQSLMTKPLPAKIYLVDRTPSEYERPAYYGWGKTRRIYHAWRYVTLFMRSHKRSSFKVYEADVEWREVEL